MATWDPWADGLGNAKGISLPECQLRKLRLSLVAPLNARTLSQPDKYGLYLKHQRLHIWFDTLCVPVSPMSERKAAIKTMKACYENASLVWVLDSGLLRTSINTAYHEILIRVATSPWLRRLWTLQEAVFAKEIVFQFQDSYTDFNSLRMPYAHSRFALRERLPTLAIQALSTFFYGREKILRGRHAPLQPAGLAPLRLPHRIRPVAAHEQGQRRSHLSSHALRSRPVGNLGRSRRPTADQDAEPAPPSPKGHTLLGGSETPARWLSLDSPVVPVAPALLNDRARGHVANRRVRRLHPRRRAATSRLTSASDSISSAPSPYPSPFGPLGDFTILPVPETQDTNADDKTVLRNGIAAIKDWIPARD